MTTKTSQKTVTSMVREGPAVSAHRTVAPAVRDQKGERPDERLQAPHFTASVTCLMSTYSSMPWVEPSRP